MSKMWCFGDSWAYGWRVEPEYSYTKLLADKLSLEFVNRARPATSMGVITDAVIKAADEFQPGDWAMVTAPPDSRWYQASPEQDKMLSLSSHDDEYTHLVELSNATPYWFEWHHSQFINTIKTLCDHSGVNLIMQHNIGEHRIVDGMKHLGLSDLFVDPDNSMAEWLGAPKWLSYSLNEDLLPYSPYCEHNENFWDDGDNHPNFQGHERIAERIFQSVNPRK